MDDITTLGVDEKRVLEVTFDSAAANSRQLFGDLREVIDAGDRIIAQQIVARSVDSEAAEQAANVVMETPTAKKSWWPWSR